MKTQKTILIIEDNPSNLKLIRDLLIYQKYNVLEATDGKTAINLVLENFKDVDLILTDLQLPDIDGLEIINCLKASPESKDIPIMVVSAHAMEVDIKKCMDAGCVDYITKPINVQDFMKKINFLLA
jgi:two-component system cell cycle response regulator DivK